MIGQKYGSWTVIEMGKKDNRNRTYWLCQCYCGKTKEIRSDNLKKQQSKTCNCKIKGHNIKDLSNMKFGKLIALYPIEKRHSDGSVIWHCRCDCGNEVDAVGWRLSNHHISSCGCLCQSVGEFNIQTVLQNNEIIFEQEKIFIDLQYQDTKQYPRYDFYLPEYNRLIEYDGEQHFKTSGWDNDKNTLELRRKRDILKNEYAINHNIDLVRIPYFERNNITLEMLLGDQYLISQ